MPATYRVSKGCTFCGTCVNVCPTSAITMVWNEGAVIDQHACTGCGACYENCASEAIECLETAKEEKEA